MVAVVGLAWLGLIGLAWNDYEVEAAPPFAALTRGDVVGFLQAAPAYGGSLVLRAPFAGVTAWLGGGELAVYRAVSIPCLLAGAALGVVLARRSPRHGWLVLALATANPIALRALEIGHPEELLGGALCVGAVIAAAGSRGLLAGLLLGLALATKAWSVLAIGPVVLALAPGARLRALGVAGAVVAAVYAPLLAAGSVAAIGAGVRTTGSVIFQPWQVFWFLGEPGLVVIGGDGFPKPDGWRTPPGWLAALTHPLIAILVIPASVVWAAVRRPQGEEVLLLLALLFAARCLLDPWNNVYYGLPFLLALLAWEALRRPAGPPVLTLGATAAAWASFEWLPRVLGPDAQSLAYLAWMLPLCMLLVRSALPASSRSSAPSSGRPVAPAVDGRLLNQA
jgi:hypothetical protein